LTSLLALLQVQKWEFTKEKVIPFFVFYGQFQEYWEFTSLLTIYYL